MQHNEGKGDKQVTVRRLDEFCNLNSSKRRKVIQVPFILFDTSFIFSSLLKEALSTSPLRSLEMGGSAAVPWEMAGHCFQPSLLFDLFYSTTNSVSKSTPVFL